MSERTPAAGAATGIARGSATGTVPDATPDAADELPGFPDPDVPGTERGTLPELVRDCRLMAARWAVPQAAAHTPVAPSSIRGTTVPAASSDVVAAMPEYGS